MLDRGARRLAEIWESVGEGPTGIRTSGQFLWTDREDAGREGEVGGHSSGLRYALRHAHPGVSE